MNRIIAQIAVAGMMTLAAQAVAGELNATESSSVQGRIFISVADFQKIIRGSERILSSETSATVEAQDVSSNGSVAALQSMNAEDKASLYKKVLPIAKHEAQVLSSTVESLKAKLAKIKADRKQLQVARLSNNNAKVQKELFANILEESNLEAKIAEAKREIQESHVLVVEFKKVGTETILVNVQHEGQSLWNTGASSKTVIAQN
ncbi:MAG TPA: hypothetical protein VM901_05510 [Bdellovibrionota bacterium]|jgi:hypothetical protein|nr:hypothetical protein [Bdellovibrionota bacterium]